MIWFVFIHIQYHIHYGIIELMMSLIKVQMRLTELDLCMFVRNMNDKTGMGGGTKVLKVGGGLFLLAHRCRIEAPVEDTRNKWLVLRTAHPVTVLLYKYSSIWTG